MKGELWRRAEELFHAAVERPPEARRAFLNEACGEDSELRRQVEVLISKDEQAGSFLEKPVVADVAAALSARGSLVGRPLGPYRILSLLGAGGMARADVFNMGGARNPDGTWTGLASLETVPVGNPGNAGGLSGEGAGGDGPDRVCGAVDYEYRIGKYEVTAAQYCEFLNAVAATDAYGLYSVNMDRAVKLDGCDIKRTGSSGNYSYSVAADYANRPVNYVSWGDAARFANWLHNGQPTGAQDLTSTEDGAYFLNGATTDAALQEVCREADWRWAITSEDEWYKAAYHRNDGVTGNYFDYPTSSDTTPVNSLTDPDGGNNANFNPIRIYLLGAPYYRTGVGEFENSDSPYGTFDQAGNVWEWNEAIIYQTRRGLRGGSFDGITHGLQAADRGLDDPTYEWRSYGFRVSQVPEPATLSLLALGGLAVGRGKGAKRRCPTVRRRPPRWAYIPSR